MGTFCMCAYYLHWHLSVSKDHRFAPIVQRPLWLWRPIQEWQSMPHLEHMKAVAGVLARHTVFLWSLFSSAFTCWVFQIVSTPILLCVFKHLCLWQPIPNSLCLCQALGGLTCICPWSVVGVILLVFSLLPVHHIKGPLECGHLSSVSHVLAIACAFALRECISLVFQPFPAPLCHLVLPCDS